MPRVWLITAATSPIGIALARRVLACGDSVIAGLKTGDLCDDSGDRGEEAGMFWDEVVKEGWSNRCRGVSLDGRNMGLCQAAVAEAVQCFGKVDIMFCCASEAVIGTVEELSTSPPNLTLVRDQFETNFFGPVNIIKAVLPTMRKQTSGHILILTGTSEPFSQRITQGETNPGVQPVIWGPQGSGCIALPVGRLKGSVTHSLAYEIAPFNIKMTIVQPNLEVNVLTNKITSAPLLPQYAPENNPAPLCRNIMGRLLDYLESSEEVPAQEKPPGKLSSSEIVSLLPKLPPEMTVTLLAETISAVLAVAGHNNPPARHIVGFEGVASVKEKLRTVSEELEDFFEVSCAVDIDDKEHLVETDWKAESV